jgi:8-oxo-dGTP diphosphatase
MVSKLGRPYGLGVQRAADGKMGARMRCVRVSVKGIVIQGGRVLVIQNRYRQDVFFALPGGGQKHGESAPNALRREFREEVGADVEVEDVVLVRDYIGRNHEFADHDGEEHSVEIMFRCRLIGEVPVGGGLAPDAWQVGVEWLDLSRLNEARLYPKVLRTLLPLLDTRAKIYIGDVN